MGNDDDHLLFVPGGDLLQSLDGTELDFTQSLATGEAHPAGEKLDGSPQGLPGQFLDLLAFPFSIFHLAQIVDKEQTLDDLAGLGATLKLPKDWTYATRILDTDEELVATGVAYVLQDDLLNSYQRK